MKKLGIVLGAVFVIVVSPFVVQYGWNEIITTIVPLVELQFGKLLGWICYYLSFFLCHLAKKYLKRNFYIL